MYTFRDCESHDSCILINISERLSNLVLLFLKFCSITRTQTLSPLLCMLDLQEYGVTKKWAIITEISKEVENNTIARVNVYARQYVSRRNVASGGSNVEGTSKSSWITENGSA